MAKKTKSVMQHNTVNLQRARELVELNMLSGMVAHLEGPPGIGKTRIMEQIAKDHGRVLITHIAQHLDIVDAKGLPKQDADGDTQFSMPPVLHPFKTELAANPDAKFILFIDELSNADREIQGMLFELMTHKKLGGFSCPEDTWIATAGNRSSDRSLAKELASAMRNRLAIIDFKGPSPDEWMTYAVGKGIHPAVTTFIREHPTYLVDEADVDQQRFPTPRAWENVSNVLNQMGNAAANNGRLRLAATAAIVGDEAAGKLEIMLDMWGRLVPMSDVIANPKKAALPDEDDHQARFMQTLAVTAAITDQQKAADLIPYVERIGTDMVGFMLRSFCEQGNSHLLYSNANLLVKFKDYIREATA